MSLSCLCVEPPNGYDYYFTTNLEIAPLGTKRWLRCRSCKATIAPGNDCLEFRRSRPASTDYELCKFGDKLDAIKLGSIYHCESCAGLYMALDELGYCISPDEDMRELVCEYNERRISDES